MTYEPVSVESLLTHQDWALRLARRLVREEGEAEDLVQRTWIAALRRPPGSERGARAWIHKVILNLARERHRRTRTRERHERAFPKSEGDVPDTLEVLSRTEIKKLLSEQLLDLAEPYRSAVLQRYYDGLSSVEIARRLGIPAGTVRWRLKVGLDQLRSGLDRRAHGDRSRWVSALLAFAPDGPDGAEPGDDATSEPIEPSSPLGLPGTAGRVVLAGAGVLGAVFLVRSLERDSREHVVHADSAASPLAEETDRPGTREDARIERSALPAEHASGTRTTTGADGTPILVVDENGEGVPGARVMVASASGFEERALSDAEGRTWLDVRPHDLGAIGLPATRGRVSVRALAEGREASALVHVAPPFGPEHEVRLAIGGPEVRIAGRVVDRHGRAVAGAVVAWFEADSGTNGPVDGDFASPSYLSTTSDGEGRYVLANVPKGRGDFGCFARGYSFSSVALDDLSPDVTEFVLRRGASVSGTVRMPDGRPAADVSVTFEPCLLAAQWAKGLPFYDAEWRAFAEATRTDAQGRFLLEGVKGGNERLLWARDERTGLVASTTLRLVNEHEEHWEAELGERTGFRLRLVDERGQALPGWFVNLRRPEMGSWWLRRRATDAEGRLFVPDCPDAEAFIDVYSPADVGASYAWRRLRPSPEEVLIKVETRLPCSIRGRVLDDLGRPELRGQLTLQSTNTAQSTPVLRDEQGNFELALVPGQYRLVLELDNTIGRLERFGLKQGEERDLGTLSLPPLGMLRLDPSALQGATMRPIFSIISVSKEWSFVQRVARGPLEGELLFPMFPGTYRVLAFDGGEKPISHVVEVQPGVETRLELRRE